MRIDFDKKELEFIFECICQSVINQDELLSDYRKQHNMTDDDIDEFSIRLRQKINKALKKMQ